MTDEQLAKGIRLSRKRNDYIDIIKRISYFKTYKERDDHRGFFSKLFNIKIEENRVEVDPQRVDGCPFDVVTIRDADPELIDMIVNFCERKIREYSDEIKRL